MVVATLCGAFLVLLAPGWERKITKTPVEPYSVYKMKHMKLGTRPDIFYTEEATRSVVSDEPTDLVIRVNNITFLLHKHILLPKSGLLQRLCNKTDETEMVDLHDIPGGEDAFELCAKFCYGISINLSAHNIVPAYCAAKFLRMTESIEQGNLVLKLELFCNSCVLQGWKDSLVMLQSTANLPEWSENLGIIRKCIDSVVEKILTPRSQVKWKYTYTRPGCIVMMVRSSGLLPPQLIGEALHVYAFRWLPDSKPNISTSSTSTSASNSVSLPSSLSSESDLENKRRILETIVSLIPLEERSVSIGFLIRLLRLANSLGASPVTKSELVRQTSLQLGEAEVNDLQLAANDLDLVKAVLESYVEQWGRRRLQTEASEEEMCSLSRVVSLMDSYLNIVTRDPSVTVAEVVSVAETLPDVARTRHDDLYKAINTYLKEHPEMTKSEKKQLCRILNCQKLSPEMRAHAVKNERLPLRTVVQVLFYEQDKKMMNK
ncbi:hypothetical protein V2J09_003278 [Rumex salicifolius]